MMASMTTDKIAVSLPRETLRRARRAVRKGRAPTISSYVASAIDQKASLDELDDLLTTMLEETGGPLTAAEERAADRAIGAPVRRKRKTA